MNLNKTVFKKVLQKNAKILVVTKYYDEVKTKSLINECEKNYGDIIFGFGENRIDIIKKKKLPREKIHFIGNLQSKKLSKIAKYCSAVHSLDSLKHAIKLDKTGLSLGVFIQIKLDKNKPNGIEPKKLKNFLQEMKKLKNIKILGISGMGQSINSEQLTPNNKKEEFKLLRKLRDKYLPKKLISAGTSQDYEIALKEEIKVVRVGRSVLNDI